jgi:1-aminocyclopropane-1-carboxylate deaminase
MPLPKGRKDSNALTTTIEKRIDTNKQPSATIDTLAQIRKIQTNLGVIAPPIVDVSDFFREIHPRAQVHMLLDFMNHQDVSGNKLRKLLPALVQFRKSGCTQMTSFGGYHSNHLAALAWLGKYLNIPTLGYINGVLPKFWGYTLQTLRAQGMQLNFLPKSEFAALTKRYTEYTIEEGNFIIPMGGQSKQTPLGFQDLYQSLQKRYPLSQYEEFWIASGTGNSALSLLMQLAPHQKIQAQKVVKDPYVFSTLHLERYPMLHNPNTSLHPREDFLFSGIGKYNQSLLDLIRTFFEQTGIPLDPIYNGKLLYYYLQNLKESKGSSPTALLVHTGGLQGIPGFNQAHQKAQLPEQPDLKKIQALTL